VGDAGAGRSRPDDGGDADGEHASGRADTAGNLTYTQALDFVTGLARFGVKLGLDRETAILDRLGNPQLRLRGALVAGTNGKGSTAAMAASILNAAGMRTGLMPKPHLSSYRERIQVDLQPISEPDFARAVAAVKPHLQQVSHELGEPTEFEMLTAIAVAYLAPRVDRLVCEVGLGGRLDATNVLDLGVAAITNVGLDHMAQLGATTDLIAAEKAAIVKPGNLVVTGCTGKPLEVVERAAAANGATLWRLGQEIKCDGRWRGWEGSEIDVAGPGFEHRGLRVPLLGSFQAANAALAVALAHAMGVTEGSAVRQGLASASWPGRLELVAAAPRVLLDGAHNPAGLERVTADVRRLIGRERLVVVFGVMADKDYPRMLEVLRAAAPEAVVFTAAADERALAAQRLAELWPGSTTVMPAPAALDRGRELAGPKGNVLVCGSLYIVGELRSVLRVR
jgi:dihydrofolate synthase/folylpolyglutamate synthase